MAGASTRMHRVPWQHVLAVGEIAPPFTMTIPFHNYLVTNYGSILASARDDSRITKHRMRYFASRTVNSSFALVHWESATNNVDAETLLGNLQFEYDLSRPAVPKGVGQAYRATSSEGSEALSALRTNLLPMAGRG